MNWWQLRWTTRLVRAVADDEKLLVVLLELFDEADEVTVRADDDVGVMRLCVDAISRASSARLTSAPSCFRLA